MARKQETRPLCVMHLCENEAKIRGLCVPCYRSAARRVRAGETTWDELIEKGWALPAHDGRRSAFDRAFMG